MGRRLPVRPPRPTGRRQRGRSSMGPIPRERISLAHSGFGRGRSRRRPRQIDVIRHHIGLAHCITAGRSGTTFTGFSFAAPNRRYYGIPSSHLVFDSMPPDGPARLPEWPSAVYLSVVDRRRSQGVRSGGQRGQATILAPSPNRGVCPTPTWHRDTVQPIGGAYRTALRRTCEPIDTAAEHAARPVIHLSQLLRAPVLARSARKWAASRT